MSEASNQVVNIDSTTFHKRLSIVQQGLTKETQSCLLFLVGSRDDENIYKKSTVLQTWLLGYEFMHTALFITEDKCIFITSEGKAKHLKHLSNKPTANSSEVEIWPRVKDPQKNKDLFVKLIDELKANSSEEKPIGTVLKDKYKGKFIDEWNSILNGESLAFVDSSLLLSKSFEVKDEEELSFTKVAAKASVVMMDNCSDEIMQVVDEEKKISNAAVADKVEDKIENDKWYLKSQLGKKLLQPDNEFDSGLVEWCYSPIIQSGGKYDLRPSALSNEDRLVGDGVIVASLGLRYKSYCSNVGRTFMINPNKELEDNYDFLIKLQEHIISNLLKSGKTSQEVFNGSISFIKDNKPDLVPLFTKNCGWLTGIEFRDSTFILNGKNERVLKDGEVISLTIGFNNLVNEKAKTANLKNYGLLLSDTFIITDDEPVLLTSYPKARSEVSFYDESSVDTETKVKTEKEVKTPKNPKAHEANSKILKSKLRRETSAADDDASAEKMRQEIQSKLHEKRLQEGLSRFSKADATDATDFKPVFKKYDSYLRESQIPKSVSDLKIHIDYKNQTIILPIYGRPVPFHINSFKNGSQNEEGDFTYLRLNFNSPGAGGNVSRRAELPYEDSPDNSFLRSITLRSRDRQRMIDVLKAIQDLKKDAVKRELERKQFEDVVSQGSLIELKGSRVKRLENVLIRPQPDTKKVGGALQIHENGLRYISSFKAEQKVDILFSNIKHLFFQPSKDELIVLIHCHLKSPLIIGKRKTYDVQFYREANDMAFDETGGRKRRYRFGDEDELQQEQEERRRKALLDKEFRGFAELIADSSHSKVDLDTPFRDLGFQGVPFRSSVFCMPTRDCLVQLIDPPYLVVTLDEIEIAHLERVQFGLKNFDLVFVFKDFAKPVVHINTIPMETLDDVKSWLTDVDIPLSEGQMNLNWAKIMKTVQSDPYQFFADGGWNFLTGDGELDSEDEEEEESEFEVSDEDPSDEDVGSEEESADDYSSGGSGSEESFEELDDGEDWDEMEKKAAREDKQFRD